MELATPSVCWQPVAIALVISSSRGNRLLFYHQGSPKGQCEQVTDVLSELPPRTLAEILAPSSLMVGHKFELNVDEWKFVGHLFAIQTSSFNIKFNVVFVLQSYCSLEVVGAYDHLSHVIGSAIVHEEHRCGFLEKEVALLTQLLEEAEAPEPPFDEMLGPSSLARSLRDILGTLQEGTQHVKIKVNSWSEVNVLMRFDARDSQGSSVGYTGHVRSYSALLLLESADSIAESLPSSCNPAFHRLLRTVSPMKSLQTVALDGDIPLVQVLHCASHLAHWGKAITIYPLSESNVYIASPEASTSVNSVLSRSFSETFSDSTLAELLSDFSLPVSLGELKQKFMDDDRIIKMVVWLLQYRQITQLHTYVYIVPLIQMAHLPGSFSPTSSGFGSDHTAFDSAPFSLRPLSRSSDSGEQISV